MHTHRCTRTHTGVFHEVLELCGPMFQVGRNVRKPNGTGASHNNQDNRKYNSLSYTHKVWPKRHCYTHDHQSGPCCFQSSVSLSSDAPGIKCLVHPFQPKAPKTEMATLTNATTPFMSQGETRSPEDLWPTIISDRYITGSGYLLDL